MRSLNYHKVIWIVIINLVVFHFIPSCTNSDGGQPIFRGEDDFYTVKNITQDADFSNEAWANSGDVLEFKIYVSNVAPGSLAHDVMVRAQLPETATIDFKSNGQIGCKEALVPLVNDDLIIHGIDGDFMDYQEGSTWMHKRLGGGYYEDTTLPDGILLQDGWYINIGNVRGGNGEDFGVDVYFRVQIG